MRLRGRNEPVKRITTEYLTPVVALIVSTFDTLDKTVIRANRAAPAAREALADHVVSTHAAGLHSAMVRALLAPRPIEGDHQ